MKNYINIENAFSFTAWTSITALAWGIIFMIFSEKEVQGYYLSSGGNNPVVISVDINNYPDPDIELVGVTYKEAIDIVNDLNKSIEN